MADTILFVTRLFVKVFVLEIVGIATEEIVGVPVKFGDASGAAKTISVFKLLKFVFITALDAEIKSVDCIVVIVLIYLYSSYTCPFRCYDIPSKTNS